MNGSVPTLSVLRAVALLLLGIYPGRPASAVAAALPVDPQANSAYAHGEAMLREHKWDEGLSILEPLLKTSAGNPRVLNLVGLAYTGKGDPRQADVYFERAIKASPGFVPALKNLGINEFGLGAFEAADNHLHAAAKLAPDDPIIQLYLGESAYRRQDYPHAAEFLSRPGAAPGPEPLAALTISDLKIGNKDAAAAILDRGLQPDSLSPRSQFSLGLALVEAGQPDRALPFLEAVHRGYPAAPELAYDLALAQLAAHQYPPAIATIEDQVAQGHETAEFDNLLAEAYEGNKQTQPAIDALRKAIELDPQDEDNYLDFASLCINHQAFKEAGQVLAVGLGVQPKSARLIFERGILNAMQDHFDQAEADFQQSADLAPQDNSAYVGLGVTYIESGNTAEAIRILHKRILERPNDASLEYLLGEALVRSGAQPGEPAFTEAQAALEKAVHLDANLSTAHAALGSLYLKQGRLEGAVVQLEQARRLDPKEKSAYSHLAVAYRRLGQQDKVKEMISRLQQINDQERSGPHKLKEQAEQ